MFSIIVAISISVIAFNTYHIYKNNYISMMGIAYAFVAVVDLLHLLTFEGMNILSNGSTNLTSQFWIIARYIESISLLLSLLLFNRRLKPRKVFLVYGAATTMLVFTVFMQLFPITYIKGLGLTPFKIYSEILITAILVAVLILLPRYRKRFHNNVFRFIILAIVCTIVAEIKFTQYLCPTSVINMLGHIFRLASFYFIYRAIIHTSLQNPFNILFFELKQLKDDLEDKNHRLEAALEEKNALLKETLEYSEMKKDFFANVSHELRTPLNLIFASLHMLALDLNDGLGQNIKKHIRIIKQNSYRLLKLVNNLIDITKIDSGFFKLEQKNENIIALVENITLSTAHYIQGHGINLVFDTDLEERIMACDPYQIERIILNLLSNAVKFTKPGGSIFVSMENKADEVIIRVEDTGCGIPREKLDKIFERFIQGEENHLKKREGSGIGLSLVKSLVEMHDGKIFAQSEPGEGSQFIIHLPVRLLPDDMPNNAAIVQIHDNVDAEMIEIEFSDIYS